MSTVSTPDVLMGNVDGSTTFPGTSTEVPRRSPGDEPDFVAAVQTFMSSRDVDGRSMAKVAAVLARAAAPLETDWVANFMFHRDVGDDIQVMSSPTSRSILMKAFITANNSNMPACNENYPHLLMPVTCVGDEVVGVVICIQDSEEESVGYYGRFHMSISTGAMLILGQPMPKEKDEDVCRANFLRVLSGERPLDQSDEFYTKSKTHIIYWPPVRGRVGSVVPLAGFGAVACKLHGTVDSESFRSGKYDKCIISARLVEQGQHLACGSCVKKSVNRSISGDHLDISSSAQAINCQCHGVLVPAGQSQYFGDVALNMSVTHGGIWAGDGACLTVIPDLHGVDVVCTMKGSVTFAIEFAMNPAASGADGDLVDRLRCLALDRCMARAVVPPLMLPMEKFAAPPVFDNVDTVSEGVTFPGSPSFNSTTSLLESFIGLPQAKAIPEARALSGVNVFPEVLPGTDAGGSSSSGSGHDRLADESGGKTETVATAQIRSHKLAVARRERNRQSAARSNARRKARNEYLKESLNAAKKRAVELRNREVELRNINIELRTKVENMNRKQCATLWNG